ncbi:hypothetical protein ACOMHN_015542 [Nucella lapillus]
MHFNENSNRSVKTDAAGNQKILVQFPKAKKGEYSIKIIKQESTYVYLQTLKAELFTKFAEDASALAQSLPQRFQDKPNDLVANYHHPTKEQGQPTQGNVPNLREPRNEHLWTPITLEHVANPQIGHVVRLDIFYFF